MRKVYYIYNSQTQTFDRLHPTFRQKLLTKIRWIFYMVGCVVLAFVVVHSVLRYPSEKELRMENNKLLAQYNILSHQLNDALEVLQDIQQRDDNLYRVIFQADPISPAIRKIGYNNTSRYEELMNMADFELVVNTTQKLDLLNKQLYIQSKSFDDVLAMCKNRDEMMKCIPAIQPVSNKDLKQTASGYGYRMDPMYGVLRFHYGMDFSAPIGTNIYATGNGTVIAIGWRTGFGNAVEIDHGFGYRTLYAHMSGFRAKVGQKVMRGEIIGFIGNTGKSTGPHLHYEVHINGQPVNPINYYYMDLNAGEYDKMLQIASNHGKIFD
ncbi:Murein DD-endopeptidase MepM [termite gut metagenome]|uniref:Murein DD-endopeptidase MepM n=1 Tax=termite gut metagenome TaxID=433724 RepID=A0A5J4RRP2_9ZZZZ